MTAATKDRDTQEVTGRNRVFAMKAAVKVYVGTMSHMDTNGRVGPGITAATGRCVGVYTDAVDNSAGAAGAKSAETKRGIFGPFANSTSTDEITGADVGADCYLVDDQTVAKTNGSNTRIVAGRVHQVETAGVWVRFD
jgi:hypothetical protein